MSKITDYKNAKAEHERIIRFFQLAEQEQLLIHNINTIRLKLDSSKGTVWFVPRGNEIIKTLILDDPHLGEKVANISSAQLESLRKEAEEEAIEFIKSMGAQESNEKTMT